MSYGQLISQPLLDAGILQVFCHKKIAGNNSLAPLYVAWGLALPALFLKVSVILQKKVRGCLSPAFLFKESQELLPTEHTREH